MRILVTVGTTRFDTLVKFSDELAKKLIGDEFIFQISDSTYIPTAGESFSFSSNIEEFYINADIVITHAGAGSIYRLLELNKKIVVVPNLERIDKHQVDIASYMEREGCLLVAWDYDELESKIYEAKSISLNKFERKSFFVYEEIATFING